MEIERRRQNLNTNCRFSDFSALRALQPGQDPRIFADISLHDPQPSSAMIVLLANTCHSQSIGFFCPNGSTPIRCNRKGTKPRRGQVNYFTNLKQEETLDPFWEDLSTPILGPYKFN